MAESCHTCGYETDASGRCMGCGRRNSITRHVDGTERLVVAVYGEWDVRKSLGGSEAAMLHDAATEIDRLRKALAEAEERVAMACARVVGAEEEKLHKFEHPGSYGTARYLKERLLAGDWRRYLPDA